MESKQYQSQYDYEKYICTKETLRHTLDKFGVAVIPSVLNEQETTDMVSGMWDFFEFITTEWETPMNRDDKTTWVGIHKLYPLHSMLIQYFSVGQAQVSWNIRQNPKVVDIFSEFWGCPSKDLLVSFDGFSFNMPPETTHRGWCKPDLTYHTDQSFKRPDFECMQTWVTGFDVEDGDATLAFYEGSNKFHQEFAEKFNIVSNKDWKILKNEEEEFYIEKGCQKKKIMCPKGSLVCWDSRTIHCGSEATRGREREKLRAVIYLCYQPRAGTTDKQLAKKHKALQNMRSTSHWPCKVKLFGKNPRTYGKDLPTISQIPPPALTSLGKRLAGY